MSDSNPLPFVMQPPGQQEERPASEPGREPRKAKFLELRVYVLETPTSAPESLAESTAALRVEPKGMAPCVVSLSLMRPKAPAPLPEGTTGQALSPSGGARESVILVAVPPSALEKPGLVPSQAPKGSEAWRRPLASPAAYFKADLEVSPGEVAFKGTLSYTSSAQTRTLDFEYPFPKPGRTP